MIRNKIVFQVPGTEILAAVQSKLEHHQGRLAHWTERRAALMADMRANGVTFEDNEIRSNMTYQGSGSGMDIKLDMQLKKDMDGAADKVREHTGLVEDYGLWERALAAHPSRAYDIDMDDWEFFGL